MSWRIYQWNPETPKIREQRLKNPQNIISKECGTNAKGITHIMEIPEGEKKGERNRIVETMTQIFPKLTSDIKQIQEAQRNQAG